jgi:thiol-disulfide isomerase/thioredoxin
MSSTGPAGGVRKAFLGALEGAVIVGLGAFVGYLVTGQGPIEAGQQGLIGAGLGAVVFAAGRGLNGTLWGAALGGLAGWGLGAYCGERFLGDHEYKRPAVEQPGSTVEIAGPTVQGPPIDLKELRGKVVLVDFWATWCGPCVAELPNMRAVYDRYHAKGFEIVGVNLDESRERLTEFIRDKKVPWPQIFFDKEGQRGWVNNPLARRYEVTGIPAMILVDQDGRMVPGSARGPALEREVVRLLEQGARAAEGTAGPRTVTLRFPLGLLVGSLAGCFAGSFGGALVERRLRWRKGAAAPPADGIA